MPNRPSVVKEYKFWVGLIGALVSAGPIISLIQKLLDVGLIPIFTNALAYYRGITYPLVDWLRYIMSFIPFLDLYRFIFSWFMSLEAYKDLTVLSFMVTAAMFRAESTLQVIKRVNPERDDILSSPRQSVSLYIQVILLILLLGYTLLPLLLVLIAPLIVISHSIGARLFYRYLILYLLIAFTAAAAFFAANELMK